ncbi:MAG: glycosyltransferase involved in cell wall biosynthesis [Flavobacteriales bacterium]|jgi:glycosyltransferase involved in cell wall biosynthesis
MKILLDPQIYDQQQYGGISRYYTELFSILSQKNIKVIIPFYSTTNVYYGQSVLVSFQQKLYSLYLRFLIKFRIRYKEDTIARNKKYLIKTIISQQYDLFIPTYYNPYFVKDIGSKPFVLTVYDMIHELFPEYFKNDSLNVVENKMYLMEKATRIIAVSENTKQDIIKIYPHIDNAKIDVVYHGCSIKITGDKEIEFLPENYILFVGTRANYKNFNYLVTSIAEIFKNNPDLYLICAGGGEFEKEENELISSLKIENQIIQRSFEEDELGFFYKKAQCFVFPSKYEGFGIPVLESMACGCPVVLANHSAFPEVAGNAGVYFELNNSKDLKNKIEMLVQNKSLRDEYSQKGLIQVEKFSWQKAAEECLAVYKKACCKNHNINDE